jgi:hypothetical protein
MRQVLTTVGLAALAGCAVAATAACASDPADSVAAPPPPSASSGAGAAASQRVGTPASPPVSPSVKPGKTIGPVEPAAEPTSTGHGGQSDIDWKRVAFRELGCKPHPGLPKRAAVTEIGHADLTGDGRPETLVTASCPTATSTNAVHVFVFAADGSDKPLLDIGEGQYLRTVDVATKGRTISIDAQALSDDASLCCPDLQVRQSWKWNGSAFVTRGAQTEEIS